MANTSHQNMANAIRFLSADAVQAANSGHPGMPMGMADVATVLFSKHLKFDAARPDWHDRDRFILSAGHGSMLIYSLLHLTGYDAMTLEEIKNFRQLNSITAGHPETGHTPGVETTTGPLGQGIANSVGFALAERILAAQYGDDLVDHRTWVIVGDGCLMEGVSQEAISLAGHLKLNKMIVLWDDNQITIDGKLDLSSSEDQQKRFQAAGWDTYHCDGHDPDSIDQAITLAKQSDKPTLIACRTTIGYGAPNRAGTNKAHGAPLGDDELAATREALDWPYPAFVVPNEILSAWRAVGAQGTVQSAAWDQRLEASSHEDAFKMQMAGELPENWDEDLKAAIKAAATEMPKLATRQSSGKALETLVGRVPGLIGGSADLTGSNNTKVKDTHSDISADDFSGNYINWGVREHGMAAAMNGMALHGGILPYAGTFLAFTDYARPAIRLSALMKQHAIYVMTHDSIGLGEDGPTHQPVEHLAALRAIPDLDVYRPADLVETLECWQLAVRRKRPAVMVLSRQGVPALREATDDNYSAHGGYIFQPSTFERQVTLIGTGTELHLAVQARAILEQKHGIGTAVVSLPCMEIFNEHPVHYRQEVLSPGSLRVAVEAGIQQGWDRYIHEDGIFIGMDSFGASAPAGVLYEHFGITVDTIVDRVLQSL